MQARRAVVPCVAVALVAPAMFLHAQIDPAPAIGADRGLRLLAVTGSQPAVRVLRPGQPGSDRSIEVLFPEHVTAVGHGSQTTEHLFLPRAGGPNAPTAWRVAGRSLEYARELSGSVRLRARAILEDDGVRFRYELSNHGTVDFDMITAVTDPRLTGVFHDPRLERTFVHHADGFELLGSEVPSRLDGAPEGWLPARVLASFTWSVPAERIEKRGDGITYYNKSRAVDAPLIVTQSSDGRWLVASFSRTAGNVWSNPQLTCQHVDPQSALPAGQTAVLEVKLLVVEGSADDALRIATRQRGSLSGGAGPR